MSTPLFSKRFSQALSLCRVTVYGAAAAAVATRSGLSLPFAYLLLAPLLLHLLLARVRSAPRQAQIYLFEWCCTLTAVLLSDPSLTVCMSLGAVFLASNTALWGWRMVPWMLASAGLILIMVGVPRVTFDPLLDGLVGAGGFVYMLALCGVAHAQAQSLLRRGSRLRAEKKALLRFLPGDAAVQLQTNTPLAARRVWLTIAFVDLAGFTRATRDLPIDALSSVLNEFLGCVTTFVEQWDGRVSKFLGDGVLCVFDSPAPAGRGNAALQAVRCLGLLFAELGRLQDAWSVRGYQHAGCATVGVASGHCYMGQWGGGERLDYTVIGAPVNLAARLQSRAAPFGGVLLDAATADLVGNAATLAAPVCLELKGVGAQEAFPLSMA